MEPNIVFVYKLETTNYVTVSNLSESGGWETFELSHCDEFDEFNHEESKPLEGRGYFIRQDDLKILVEEVNKQIKQQRRFTNLSEHKENIVHIVSPEFAAGALRVGLERPKTVIGFPDFFSIGPLWKLDEKIGQTYRVEWLTENINFENDEDEYQIKFTNTLREIEDLPDHHPIYIWYGNNASEQVFLRFILYILRNKTNEIYLVNSSELYERYIITNSEHQTVFHTGQLEPEDLKLLFYKNKEEYSLSNDNRVQFLREWQTLSQTKEVLRVWNNNKIIGVPEHHYDPIIISTLEKLHNEQVTKDFIKTGIVIGEIVLQMKEPVDYFYIEYRIRHLVYSGVLELKGIPKSIRHYSIKIR
jgi:hypothetical protein